MHKRTEQPSWSFARVNKSAVGDEKSPSRSMSFVIFIIQSKKQCISNIILNVKKIYSFQFSVLTYTHETFQEKQQGFTETTKSEALAQYETKEGF